jgi:hypothetical protein
LNAAFKSTQNSCGQICRLWPARYVPPGAVSLEAVATPEAVVQTEVMRYDTMARPRCVANRVSAVKKITVPEHHVTSLRMNAQG